MQKYIENTKKFLREVRSELAKVTWPSWPELKGSTMLVILVSIFFAVYIWALDTILVIVRQFVSG
jgi:preprotein translocase subunit SecE